MGSLAESDNIRFFAGDMRQKLAQANLLSATLDAFEEVDILVNACRQVAASDPLNPDDDAVETLMQQNLMTALRMSQLVARRMIKQAKESRKGTAGAIVNLSSIAARRTHPDLMAYSISSAALDQMTRSLAVALAPHRIRVNAVAFGSVMSASLKHTLREHADYRDGYRGSHAFGPHRLGDRACRGGAIPRLGRGGLHDRADHDDGWRAHPARSRRRPRALKGRR